MNIGYARVSTTEQNLGLRHDNLKPAFDTSVDYTDDRESSLEVRLRGPQSIMVRRVEAVINTLILKAQAPV